MLLAVFLYLVVAHFLFNFKLVKMFSCVALSSRGHCILKIWTKQTYDGILFVLCSQTLTLLKFGMKFLDSKLQENASFFRKLDERNALCRWVINSSLLVYSCSLSCELSVKGFISNFNMYSSFFIVNV